MKTEVILRKAYLQEDVIHNLTVVIPTLNEIEYLPGLLNSLNKQTRLADEIIVADAGSIDGTAEYARRHGAQVIRGGLPAIGRNAGVLSSKGDILLFLDADVLPSPDFIDTVLNEFIRKEYDVATCLISDLDENIIDKLICVGTNIYFRIMHPISPHAPGFCIISKRVFHERIGGFDESLSLSEDIDYARRAKQHGSFGILTDTRIPVSMRRVSKEGLVGIGLKYAWCEIYALMGKPVRVIPFEYEFGSFGPSHSTNERAFFKNNALHLIWKKFAFRLQR